MRTRFAPSPTGFLHIGGLRTALYAYLLAKQSKGAFVLRIEDTDQTRTIEGATENIINTLKWAGIEPDEGPFVQSERLDLYKEHAQKLIDSGHAYPCFCSSERLEQMRKDQQASKQAPMYDRLCLSLSEEEVQKKIDAGEPHVIRLKIPREKTISWEDKVRGTVKFEGHTVDDQVLLKSDGFPTYHLANVVDDHLMEIDLVLRGEEWLSSTPKHLLLYEAFGWTPPEFAHVPLLLNKDKSKLSKRDNDVAVEDYIEKGYLPEALINFIAFLGWNPGTTQEIFSLDELIKDFSLDRIQKGGAVFDLDKLNWLQGQWIRKIPPEEFAERIKPLVEERFAEAKSDGGFAAKAAAIQERLTFFPEAPDMLSYFYEEPTVTLDLLANKKQKVTEAQVPEILQLLIDTLKGVDDWNEDKLKEILFAVAEEKDFKRGQILWPLRAALTGLPYSPGAFEVAVALGKEASMQRLEKALTVAK